MAKFDCQYLLQIGLGDLESAVEVELPFTVEFDVKRDYFANSNYGQLRIYNLSEKKRNSIRKDQLAGGAYRSILFKAGYGSNLSTIISGNITSAQSVREGNDYITTIQCFDAGNAFIKGFTSLQFPKGTAAEDVIKGVVKSMKPLGVSAGSVGNFAGKTGRGSSYAGNQVDILSTLTGGGVFIDNGSVHCLNDDEVIEGEQILISSETGLLGTPTLQQTVVHLDILFEPRVKVGQAVQLNSITNKKFSGEYKVCSISHKGVISGAVSGSRTTSLGLIAGKFKQVPVEQK